MSPPRYEVPTFTKCTVTVGLRLPLHPRSGWRVLFRLSLIRLSIFSLLTPSTEVLDLYPYSQRHSHIDILLFILASFVHPLSGSTLGLPSIYIPYRRFEMCPHCEASNMDSSSHNLGLTISNHRLADHLGSIRRLPLIGIFLGASHRFLLMPPACPILLTCCRVNRQPYSRYYTLRFVAHTYYQGSRASELWPGRSAIPHLSYPHRPYSRCHQSQ